MRAYFAAINDHRYVLAHRLGGDSGSLKAFILGFADTRHDTVTIDSVSGDVVTAHLRALQADGTVKKFQGTYTVINGVISSSNVHQVSQPAGTAAAAPPLSSPRASTLTS